MFEYDAIRIIPLTLDQVRMSIYDPNRLAATLGFPEQTIFNPDVIIDIAKTYTIPALVSSRSNWPKRTRWLAISLPHHQIVAEFMIKTGPEADGSIEIGYGVYPEAEGKGFMTQTLRCFIQWCRTQPAIRRITAETEKGNVASIQVLKKNGFNRFDETDEFYWWELAIPH